MSLDIKDKIKRKWLQLPGSKVIFFNLLYIPVASFSCSRLDPPSRQSATGAGGRGQRAGGSGQGCTSATREAHSGHPKGAELNGRSCWED